MSVNEDGIMTPDWPRVSVGMPVYNSEEFIGEAIESILGQSFSDIELIISDNASQDATGEICRRYAATDRRVRYYTNSTNIGVTGNYNKVFEYAKGEYFKWASGNDRCEKEMIERCVQTLIGRPDAVLCYPKTRLFHTRIAEAEDYEDRLDLQQTDPVSRFESLIGHVQLNNAMNGVIRTDALKRIRPYQAFWSSDFIVLAELVLQGKFVEYPERLFYRRISAQAHSSLLSKEQILGRLWPKDKHALAFRAWRLLLGYFGAVRRSRLSHTEKVRLYVLLVKRLKWDKETYVRELISVFRR